MKTLIYCRISLDSKGEELGVQRQEAECRDLARRNGWTVDEVLVDNDLSATSGVQRPAFEALLKRTDVERVLVWHTDRIVRKTSELEKLIDCQFVIHTVAAGDLDLSTPSAKMMARVLTSIATYEVEHKAERQRASHRQRAERGLPFWGSNPPLGYTPGGELVEDEAEMIRKGYEMVLGGASMADVAREWTASGVQRRRGAGAWTTSKVGAVLRHPRNAGVLRRYTPTGDGEIVGKGTWPAIVTEDQYTVALSMMGQSSMRRRGQGRKTMLLSGVATCAECGAGIMSRGTYTSTGGEKLRYYGCRQGCRVICPEKALDELVEKELLRLLASPSAVLRAGEVQGGSEQAREVAAKLAKVTQRRREIDDDYADGDLSRTEYRALVSRSEARVAELSRDLERYAAPRPLEYTTLAKLVSDWRSGSLTLAVKQQVLREWFRVIELGHKGRARLSREHVRIETWK